MLIYPELQKTYAETVLVKRSKNVPLSRDEQLLAEYIENENALTELLGNIKLAIDSQGSFSDKDAAKLAQLQDQRRNLEENLIKKYQK